MDTDPKAAVLDSDNDPPSRRRGIGLCLSGGYFGVGSSTDRYRGAREGGYSKAFAMDVIANIRTDLDAFSKMEQAVLMNHGYALIDAAIRTHAPELITTDAPFALPSAAFAPPMMAEDDLGRRLVGSGKRKLTGRGGSSSSPIPTAGGRK